MTILQDLLVARIIIVSSEGAVGPIYQNIVVLLIVLAAGRLGAGVIT